MNQEKNQEKEIISTRETLILEAFKFNLMSDTFMSVALADKAACQHALRILTGIKDLEVKEVRTQYTISKITSRGAKLDVLATDGRGKIYNIEIQRKGTIDHGKRTRFYSSMVDSEFLQKGKEYSELPDVYIIYISEEDIWKVGKTTYSVKKVFAGTDIEYDDGVQILYVNAHVDDGSEIADLMKYFTKADPYDDSQGDLSKYIHFLKCEEGGHEIMCEITEKFIEIGMERGIEQGIEQGIEKNKLETVEASLKQGLSIEIIAAITGFTAEEIKKFAISK